MTGVTLVQSAVSSDIASSATLGAGLTLGNTLLLIAADYTTGSSAASPVQFQVGATQYTVPAAFLGEAGSGGNAVAYSAWLVPVGAGMAGATALGFTPIGSGPLKMYGVELSCAPGAVITLDQALPATVNGTAAFSSGTVTTTQGNELAFFVIAGFNSVPSSGVSAPWTQIGTSNEMPLWYQNGVPASTGLSLSGSMTATADWASGLFTLYAAGGGAPSGTGAAAVSLAGSSAGGSARSGSGNAAALLAAAPLSPVPARAGHGLAVLTLHAAASAGSPARFGTGTAAVALGLTGTASSVRSGSAAAALLLAARAPGRRPVILPGLPSLPFPDDYPQVLDVAGNLLTFAAMLVNPLPGAAVLWPGNEVAWDIPDGGLLYVRVISQVPHGDPRCWNQFSTASLGLGCLRCVSSMEADGGPPPWAERTADAEQVLLDAQSLLQAALELPSQFTVINPNWVSLGPSGGVAGGEWVLPVSVTA